MQEIVGLFSGTLTSLTREAYTLANNAFASKIPSHYAIIFLSGGNIFGIFCPGHFGGDILPGAFCRGYFVWNILAGIFCPGHFGRAVMSWDVMSPSIYLPNFTLSPYQHLSTKENVTLPKISYRRNFYTFQRKKMWLSRKFLIDQILTHFNEITQRSWDGISA